MPCTSVCPVWNVRIHAVNAAHPCSPIVQLMGQGRAVDEALRARMGSELRALEDTLHAALMGLASASTLAGVGGTEGGLPLGGVVSGDVVFVEVELALRSVQNGVMEMAAVIVDR